MEESRGKREEKTKEGRIQPTFGSEAVVEHVRRIQVILEVCRACEDDPSYVRFVCSYEVLKRQSFSCASE